MISGQHDIRSGLYVGLISGTSMDGVDAAVVEIDSNRVTTLAYQTFAYDEQIKSQLIDLVVDKAKSELGSLTALHVQIGHAFSDACNKLLAEADISSENIEAIGSHGQTVFHDPDSAFPYSLQLGDPSVIAARCGITTVADFRNLDIAYGGQGAPLAPAFHLHCMQQMGEAYAILNIGGIANLTIPARGSSGDALGFDTGPGNCLSDIWIGRCRGDTFDEDGKWAADGQVIPSLLAALMDYEYIRLPPPKSTGRELYDMQFIEAALRRVAGEYSPVDVQATLVAFSAESIANAYRAIENKPGKLFVCGGGVKNRTLMEMLSERLAPTLVFSTDEIGLNPDAVEATAFAWFAACRLAERPLNIATGGQHAEVILGAVYAPTH